MPYLMRITDRDYREYRRNFSKIEYSFLKKGDVTPLPTKLIHDASMVGILSKYEFLKIVQDSRYAFYLYKNDNDEIIGVTSLLFKGRTCTIMEFCVFEHFQGLGRKLYEQVAEVCRERRVYELELWCPFDGAQEFWKKMEFYEKKETFFYKRISKH